jgi:hypothetical protein
MTKKEIIIKVPLSEPTYKELLIALDYFSQVPVIHPQTHQFILNQEGTDLLYVILEKSFNQTILGYYDLLVNLIFENLY